MRYRAEIDGLRAIAVAPVILFHAGFSAFSGGFVGVDVFFVISGYLITTILLSDITEGRFSLVSFYERRARRILPPLFVVLLACVPFAWFWLLPRDLKSLSQSFVAVSAFVSNVLFFRQNGYFDTAAELKPLLHTWSLAVEEQYYVFFPLFLLVAWRLGRRWVLLSFVLLGIASLAAAQWAVVHKPAAAFYLLPTRGWELLIGAGAALYLADRERSGAAAWAAEALSATGLLLIAYAVVAYGKQTPFPSFYALVPTVGAVLIILFATPETSAGKFLSSKLLVGLGLISYSAYLWHQPLFAFARLRSLNAPGKSLFLLLALISLGLAYLSWRYVERPFRDKQAVSGKRIFAFATLGTAAIAALGVTGVLANGYPSRLDSRVRFLANFEAQNRERNVHECRTAPDEYPREVSCVIGDRQHIVGALLGDSHAGALLYSFGEALASRSIGFLNMNYGCPPVPGLYRVDLGSKNVCAEHNRKVFQYLASHPKIKYVVMTSRWTLYLERKPYDNGEGGVEIRDDVYVDLVTSGVRQSHDEATRRELVKQKYEEAIENYLKMGKTVILVYPVPEVGWNVPALIGKRALFNVDVQGDLTHSYASYAARNREAIAALDAVGDRPNLIRIRPDRIFCNTVVQGRCMAELGGVPLYFDDNHLSNAGAAYVVKEIMPHLPDPAALASTGEQRDNGAYVPAAAVPLR